MGDCGLGYRLVRGLNVAIGETNEWAVALTRGADYWL